VAPTESTVLLLGESGTGKELFARAVHGLSPRRGGPFVALNCAAIPETLIENELFGHERGAFTGADRRQAGRFEQAAGGTFFLDEIGELPLAVQAKLLRVLETGEVQRVGSLQPKKVDVRIVAATNRDLRAEADAGRFRADLFYRLNVVELSVPPLRDRREDIPYLTAAFVKEFSERFDKTIEGVSPAAERILISGEWAGNVRELRNVIERACMLSEGRTLNERDLLTAMPASRDPRVPVNERPRDLGAMEKEHIVRVLADVRGNKVEAARRLGISRRTLYRRLERHGLMDPPVSRP
jgi:two-component system, NtrC family, response regulator HydG